MPKARAVKQGTSLKLKPANPFELVRWLARSQSDPRKAVAELVQNSLDAGATHIGIERVRIRGRACLVVRDDGEGVLPDLGREDALRYLTANVGHSRKLGIDPGERARRVIAGKYGVGLLGFWCVGRWLELRTRVAGSPLFALRLEEDAPNAELLALPLAIDAPATYTEIVVSDLHPTAQKALGGRRLADYLASELRGQLLRHDVELTIVDGIARGTAQKRFAVVPRRFTGEPLALPSEIGVPGLPPLRVELYLARGADRPAVQVACAGTVVADDIAELEALGLRDAPWVGRDLSGLLDFAGFNVPPGTRRGVVPDRAAAAFVEALDQLAPRVVAELERLEAERRSVLDRDVVRDLRRALRGFRRRLPKYELPHVATAQGEGDEVDGDGAPLAPGTAAGPEKPAKQPEQAPLFPPGPLAAVRIAPAVVRVTPGGERRVRAVATDADGRAVKADSHVWSASGAAGVGVSGEGPGPAVTAAPSVPVGAEATLEVSVRAGERTARSTAAILVVDEREDDGALGIPEPNLISDFDAPWRSRLLGDRWEVNDAHEDYRSLATEPRARVRYLLALLAKEIVLRSSGRPDASELLESLVEVLAHAERNLRGS